MMVFKYLKLTPTKFHNDKKRINAENINQKQKHNNYFRNFRLVDPTDKLAHLYYQVFLISVVLPWQR